MYFTREATNAAEEFLLYLDAHFHGFTPYIGIEQKNLRMAQLLTRHQYKLIEESTDMRLQLGDLPTVPTRDDVQVIDAVRLDGYLSFHQQYFPDIYWTAEKIAADTAPWLICVCRRDRRIVGSILLRKDHPKSSPAEVYAAYAEDQPMYEALACACMRQLQCVQPLHRTLLWLTEDAIQTAAATHLGFAAGHGYRCYSR